MKKIHLIFVLTIFPLCSVFGQWIPTSPQPLGSVYCFFDDSASQKIYAGTAGFGIYGTMNGGEEWNRFNSVYSSNDMIIKDWFIFFGTSGAGVLRTSFNTPNSASQVLIGEKSAYVNAVIAYNNGIYVGCGSGYVYRSLDNGDSWTELNSGLNTQANSGVTSFVIAENELFLGCRHTGIYKLSSTGNAWEAVSTGINQNSIILSLASIGSSIYAGTSNEGVYVSNDRGNSWNRHNSGLPINTSILSLKINQNIVFAGLEKKGVYKSSDGGVTWSSSNNGINDLSVFDILGESNELLVGTNEGVFKSSDHGANWANKSQGIVGKPTKALLYHNGDLLSGTGNSIFRSPDLGNNWIRVYRDENRESSDVNNILATNDAIYATATGNKVLRSLDNGLNWQLVGNGINYPRALDIVAVNDNMIFACDEIRGVLRSDDKGVNWISSNNDLPFYSVRKIEYNGQYLFVSTIAPDSYIYLVYRSPNLGENWEFSSLGLLTNNLLSMKVNGSTIFCGLSGYGLYRSLDNGSNWASANNGIPSGSWGYYLGNHYGLIVAGIYNHDEEHSGFYYSRNNGDSWEKLNDGLPFGTVVYSSELVNTEMFIGTTEGIFYREFEGVQIPPNNLVAIAHGNDIQLTWVDNASNEEGFQIERKIGANGTWSRIAIVETDVSSYIDNVVSTDRIYYYQVKSYTDGNVSVPSNSYYAITMNAPDNLVAESYTNNEIVLTWIDNSINEDGYKVERRLENEWVEIADLSASNTSFEDKNVIGGLTYFYRVHAYANSTTPVPHLSNYSNEVGFRTNSNIQESFALNLPLNNFTPFTAPINSVFDHSISSYYGSDGVVTAYTGEKGEKRWGSIQDGYMQESKNEFLVNGNYTAAGLGTAYLFYDGHPGIDFRAPTGTVIYAPADGEIFVPNSDPVNGNPLLYNTIMIKHNDEYSTWYLHCSEHTKTSGTILKGEPFAKVGSAGTEAPHLHFEIRKNNIPFDPYGWQGIGSDPYNKTTSEFIWDVRTENTVWNFSDSFEMWQTRDALNKGINKALGGKWNIDPGNDPGLISPQLLNASALIYREVEIRMSVEGDGEIENLNGNVYFKTNTRAEFSLNAPVEFDRKIIKDGNQYIYKADMTKSDDWIGEITAIRVDPIANGSSTLSSDLIYVDYIKLNSINNYSVIGSSSINLSIITPQGLIIDKDTVEVSGAGYFEDDFNHDGEIEDIISINNPEQGIYQIFVLPEPNAMPMNKFSLYSIANGDTTTIINNGLIGDLSSESIDVKYTKSVDPENKPENLSLSQNYPNPFNSTTKIKYTVFEDGNVNIRIFDIRGKLVQTLVDHWQTAGTYIIRFNPGEVSNGIYFYQLISGTDKISKKMLLIK